MKSFVYVRVHRINGTQQGRRCQCAQPTRFSAMTYLVTDMRINNTDVKTNGSLWFGYVRRSIFTAPYSGASPSKASLSVVRAGPSASSKTQSSQA